MAIEDILESALTPDQLRAAIDPAPEVLCLACAGSGKSRTLAFRIAHLIASGAEPSSIVAFTFTEKAAESIKRRVAEALTKACIDPNVMGAMYIGTIHSYCKTVLGQIDARYRQFEVLDENRLKLFLLSRYRDIGLHNLRARDTRNRLFEAIKQVSDAWKLVNDEMVDINEVTQHDSEIGQVLIGFKNRLDLDQFIDFSSMIRNVVDALENFNPQALRAVSTLKHLMIDEYQDVSPSQFRLIQLLHTLSDTLFVVGDDDQAIYAWRGADVSNILKFDTHYPDASIHTLSDNFRSTSTIVNVSSEFVKAELGASRIEKNPQAIHNRIPQDSNVLYFPGRDDEAEWIARRIEQLLGTEYVDDERSAKRGLTPGDFAILMRSTRGKEGGLTSRHAAFTSALSAHRIPFTLEAGGGPFERIHVSVLRSTFELLRDGSPARKEVHTHFTTEVLQAYPKADFDSLAAILTEWGRKIHTPRTPNTSRRRVHPQELVYSLLDAFRVYDSNIPDEVWRDIGLFSRMIQDVEAVYTSVDDVWRFREILNFLQQVAENGYDVSTDDILQRPDAVTVATIHKVKGLEFPVVFVVDTEQGRFPSRRYGYGGWLPNEVVSNALSRGAYQGSPDEEARLFYTAITRAERYLYVTASQLLPNGRKKWNLSTYAARLLQFDGVGSDPDTLPEGLEPCTPRQRIDETCLPTSFSEIRYYLQCPRNYRFRKGFGLSPSIPDMFGFGLTVHTALEKLHELYPQTAPTAEEAASIAYDVFHLKHVNPSRDPQNAPGAYERAKAKAAEILSNYATDFDDDFLRQRQVEARFEIPAQDSVITGAIDLLLHEDQQGNIESAEVIDFKAMEGGDDPTNNANIDWTELALQVQLYAKAAKDVLGENASTGAVHLLKDGARVQVPVTNEAVKAAIDNIEWAVHGIISGDYPMRPHAAKCEACDFRLLCSKKPEGFQSKDEPPALHLPNVMMQAKAFSQFDPNF